MSLIIRNNSSKIQNGGGFLLYKDLLVSLGADLPQILVSDGDGYEVLSTIILTDVLGIFFHFQVTIGEGTKGSKYRNILCHDVH
jgi:hypothetical protein